MGSSFLPSVIPQVLQRAPAAPSGSYAAPLDDEDPYADQELDPLEEFQPSAFEQFLESLAGGVASIPPPRAKGFGQNFALGLTRGLASQGARVGAARQEFERRREERRKAVDADRLLATREARKRRLDEKADVAKEGRAEKREEVTVDDRLVAVYPQLAGVKGETLSGPQFKRLTARDPVEEAAKRGREERQIKASELAARSAERQERVANATTTNQLGDDFNKDPDISIYRGSSQTIKAMQGMVKLATGPSDLALLNNLARIVEPPGTTSVVREEDLRNASQSVGKMQRFLNLPKEYITGNRLTESGRQQIMATARSIVESRRQPYEFARSQYIRRAAALGADPNDFIRAYGAGDDAGAAAPGASNADKAYVESLRLP